MNRFRTKKKNREGAETPTGGRSYTESNVSQPSLKPSKTFRLGKKQVEQPREEPVVDLTNALPAEEDFRTSLLMSGLSARFSMLREQDDPNTKIGKASDDSVLFPKRKSRLNDFGFVNSNLFDIAEVSSIRSGIRPPFADDRKNSFGSRDSYATDEDWSGSVMSRPRPTEGNNLFGGRQKIYKLPANGAASSKNLADGEGGMGGRALYDDDVSQSAFQKLREREKAEREAAAAASAEQDEEPQSRSTSPAFAGYNRKRETSSTTSSGPTTTRSSTAATSITSQRTPSITGGQSMITPATSQSSTPVLERSATKSRRLWESASEQHMHEQQAAALQRFDTISKRNLETRNVDSRTSSGQNSPNVASLAERFERPHILSKGSTPNLRANSPPPAASVYTSFEASRNSDPKGFGGISPPLSPPMSDVEETSTLSIQPNDRGKATALGAFHKPLQPYDENKFMQRQIQLQQGRQTPPLRKNSLPAPFVIPPVPAARGRAESSAASISPRLRSESAASRPFHALPTPVEERKDHHEAPIPEVSSSHNNPAASGTFLSSPNPSSADSEDFTSPRTRQMRGFYPPSRPVQNGEPFAPFEHPALRKIPDTSADEKPEPPEINVSSEPTELSSDPGPDSPTLGPIGASGLSGMVRQHLRSDSGASSVYGAPSPGLTSRFPARPPSPGGLRGSEHSGKNPWELEDWVQTYRRDAALDKALQEVEHVVENQGLGLSNADVPSATDASEAAEEDSSHRRELSADSQSDFVSTLASRRRQVQENLKSFVEADAGTTAQVPEWQKDLTSLKPTPLGILRQKTSRSSMAQKAPENAPSKTMKMLGLNSATNSPSKAAEDLWAKEEEEMLRPINKAPRGETQVRNFRQARRDAQRDRERELFARHAGSPTPNEGTMPVIQGSPNRAPPPQPRQGPYARRPSSPSRMREPVEVHPAHRMPPREDRSSQESKRSGDSSRSDSRPPSRATRDRSSSEASRSQSRAGRYKDTFVPPPPVAYNGHPAMQPESASLPYRSPNVPAAPFQRSPGVPSPNPGNRSRANSKSRGYFDSHPLTLPPDPVDLGLSPRPSPVTPFSANSTPPLALPAASSTAPGPSPSVPGFQTRVPLQKRVVSKYDISEPTLVSHTSRITTVDLPPGSSLQNGMENAPPVPPINPRRRQKTATIFGGLVGKNGETTSMASPPLPGYDSASVFSDDEDKPRRQKLRKSMSEGGHMNARARLAAQAGPSPALPGAAAIGVAQTAIPAEGAMF